MEFEVDSSNDTFFLQIDLASLSQKDVGEYELKIRLKDDKEILKNDYTMKIKIKWEEKEEKEEKPVFKGVIVEERDNELKEAEGEGGQRRREVMTLRLLHETPWQMQAP